MHQNTGDDDISFIGRGLFESLDSIGGSHVQQQGDQQQQQQQQSHHSIGQSSSPLPLPSTPNSFYPYSPGPRPTPSSDPFQDGRTRLGDVPGESRGRRDDPSIHPSFEDDRRRQSSNQSGSGGLSNPSGDFALNTNITATANSSNEGYSFARGHPFQHLQPGSSSAGFQPRLPQSDTSTSSSTSTILPFSTELDQSSHSSSSYHPPSQHALPPDPLYQIPSLSGNQFSNQSQTHPFFQSQQQQQSSSQMPSSQRQPLHLQIQPGFPTGIVPSMTLPVGMGGINPKLAQNGRVNMGPGRTGRGPGEGPQGSAQAAGREPEEEISTIFVVGFPDDMQEREFQNMFTFCKDFEAATLKLPHASTNPSNTPLSNANPSSASSVTQAALALLSNPSNLSTADPNFYLNNPYLDPSFLDNLQDAPSSSNTLGLASSSSSNNNASAAGFNSNNLSARKQIIGFAKFKTKQAAMEARDALQGRKVDVERASVLKAEMAKKNLHTRRGVGGEETGGPLGGSSTGGVNSLAGSTVSIPSLGLGGINLANGAMGRGRGDGQDGLGTKPPMSGGPQDWPTGPGSNANSNLQRQFPSSQQPLQGPSGQHLQHLQQPSNFASFNSLQDSLPYLPSMTQGPQPGPLHPPHHQQQLSPPFLSPLQYSDQASSRDFLSAVPQTQHFPLSPPPQGSYQSSNMPGLSSSDSHRRSSDDFPAFSPPLTPGTLQTPQQIQAFSAGLNQPRSGKQQQQQPQQPAGQQPLDSAVSDRTSDPRDASSETEERERRQSSIRQSSGSGDGANSGSSASSSFGKNGGDRLKSMPRTSNPADMNPPINTLYVGNLPTASSTATTVSQLEESLRSLFSRCEGFRRMSFRQKSNGPMCFVEFEDVDTASAALKEYYGNNLGGLVKGGIRLSFSKNSLGQRNAVPPPINPGASSPPATATGLSNGNTGNLTSPPLGSRSMSSSVDNAWDSNVQRLPPRHSNFGIAQTSLSLPTLAPLPPRPVGTFFPTSSAGSTSSQETRLGASSPGERPAQHAFGTAPSKAPSGAQGWKPSGNFSPFGNGLPTGSEVDANE